MFYVLYFDVTRATARQLKLLVCSTGNKNKIVKIRYQP